MNIHHQVVALAPFLEASRPPVLSIELQPGQQWLVPGRAVIKGTPTVWHLVRTGAGVTIPLYKYLVQPQPHLAMLFAQELATTGLAELPGRPQDLLLVFGDPVQTVQDGQGRHAFQFYCGLAARMQ